jgi:hypothetical protein
MKSKSCSVKSAKHTKYENQAATGPAEAFFVPLGDDPGRFSPTAHAAPWGAAPRAVWSDAVSWSAPVRPR